MGTFIAQASNGSEDVSGAAVAIVLLFLWFLGGLALIPATIASKKGYSGVGYFFFGLVLFVPALIVALLIQPKLAQAASGSQTRGTSGPANTGITWTHTGIRYLLGYTVENPYYGIWDRGDPGPPAMKFPYTEHGKAEAVARYRELEPAGQGIGSGGAGLPAPPHPVPSDASGRWAAGPNK